MKRQSQLRGSVSQIQTRVACAAAISSALALVLLIGATLSAQAQTFSTLYNFTGNGDSANPFAGLVRDTAGNLYGTTIHGGAYGYGTVYKLDIAGNETVLYSFAAYPDAEFSWAPLILDAAGNLYGSTFDGGALQQGAIFKLDTTGQETVLYSFAQWTGKHPIGALVRDSMGDIYGVTSSGGASGHGAVFRLNPTGKEAKLHSFTGIDGSGPAGGIVRDESGGCIS